MYNASSKSGKFHRAIDENGRYSDGTSDLGMEGYNLCRIRFSDVCHCTSMTVGWTRRFQTISNAMAFHERHVGRAFRHNTWSGKSFNILTHISVGRNRNVFSSTVDWSLRRGGLCCARGIQQHKSDILAWSVRHPLWGKIHLARGYSLGHQVDDIVFIPRRSYLHIVKCIIKEQWYSTFPIVWRSVRLSNFVAMRTAQDPRVFLNKEEQREIRKLKFSLHDFTLSPQTLKSNSFPVWVAEPNAEHGSRTNLFFHRTPWR